MTIAAQAVSYEPRSTRWKNNTRNPQRVTIHMDGVLRTVVWQPGEEKELSDVYDEAIQKVHGSTWDPALKRQVGGVVKGGLAPAMTNISLPDDKRPTLHESIDHEKNERLHREAMAAAAVLQARTAQDLALIAELRATEPDAPKPQQPNKK